MPSEPPCRICEQTLRIPTEDGHHQEQSPIERDICLGCWIFGLELEKFLIRKTGKSLWSFEAEQAIRRVLEAAEKPWRADQAK